MRVNLIAAGTRMPAWIDDGYREYARRMPRECRLTLTEIALGPRGKSASTQRAVEAEGKRMLDAAAPGEFVIALEVRGQSWSTPQLAEQLRLWMQDGRDVALLVGGPDGLAPECLARAEQRWSLSPLTLPHPLVRVVVAEQLYRAWTLITGHPYHRA